MFGQQFQSSGPGGTIPGILYAKRTPPKRSQPLHCGGLSQIPDVVAGQIDVLPAKRRNMRQAFRGNRSPALFKRRASPFASSGIPANSSILNERNPELIGPKL